MLKNKFNLIFLFFLFFLGCNVSKHPSSSQESINKQQPVSKGNRAKDFSLTTLNGEEIKLSDFKGKVIILDFWATWCPPCRQEIPDFVDLYSTYKDKGLIIIGVCLTKNEASLRSFAEQYNVNYYMGLGSYSITQLYGGIRAIPTTFVIDRQGNIVKKYVGYRDKSVFEQDINNLL